MTEQANEEFNDFSQTDQRKVGFFEKVLYRQLDLSDSGFLEMKSPLTKHSFGDGNNS